MSSGKKRPRTSASSSIGADTAKKEAEEDAVVPNDLDFGTWSLVWQQSQKEQNENDETSRLFRAKLTSRQECQVTLQGRGRLRSLSPANIDVEVNGFRLSSTSRWVDFDSLKWSSWVTLELPKQPAVVEIQSLSTITTNSPSFSVLCAHDPDARPTVILPTWRLAVQAIQRDFWDCYVPQQSKANNMESLLLHRSSLEDDDDKSTASQSTKSQQYFQVLFAGAKGVGKSTCLRYCLNQLLSSSSSSSDDDHRPMAVAVLDADVGQPEMDVAFGIGL